MRKRTGILIIILAIATLMLLAYAAVTLTMDRPGEPVKPAIAILPFLLSPAFLGQSTQCGRSS